ncbi:hypothetical protein [Paraclostridium bifermentans]|uniref:hypothetical protein n=1 Tax=Paraclostridium bifermentans TaxID=1490 RepID=UPI00374E5E21
MTLAKLNLFGKKEEAENKGISPSDILKTESVTEYNDVMGDKLVKLMELYKNIIVANHPEVDSLQPLQYTVLMGQVLFYLNTEKDDRFNANKNRISISNHINIFGKIMECDVNDVLDNPIDCAQEEYVECICDSIRSVKGYEQILAIYDKYLILNLLESFTPEQRELYSKQISSL